MASKEYAKVRELFKPGLAIASDPTMLVREKMTATHPTAKPKDIIERLETIAGVPCAWVTTPDAGDTDRVVLLVHGGAFVSTKLPHYIPYCAGLSRHIPARFLVHEYSLAPEARFPTQIDETCAVYRGLLDQGIAPAGVLEVPFVADRLGLVGGHPAMADLVHRASLGGGQQPRRGIVGQTIPGPLLQRGDQRILGALLCQADIPHHPRDPRDDAGRFEPPHAFESAPHCVPPGHGAAGSVRGGWPYRMGHRRSGSSVGLIMRRVPDAVQCPHAHPTTIGMNSTSMNGSVAAMFSATRRTDTLQPARVMCWIIVKNRAPSTMPSTPM